MIISKVWNKKLKVYEKIYWNKINKNEYYGAETTENSMASIASK